MSDIPNKTEAEVIARCAEYMPEEKLEVVKKAARVAKRAHRDQRRKSGEPYYIHPIQVAGILADLKMDYETVASGFLHDVVEDTGFTLEDIEYLFNPTIRHIVDGVTKLGKVKYRSKEEQQAENHRKMLLAMANDLRVIMVKLADRLHNMRTLQFHRREKQIEISTETLEIYAQLADRLGISQIKWELEDTALRYINPEEYYRIAHLMNSRREDRERFISQTIDAMKTFIDESVSGDYEIYGRPKHIYSVYKKMKSQHKSFEDIYDLLAIRVLVPTLKDCYAVLGVAHTHWRPLPNRFKDYIAMPKANGYQSLHTTVLGLNGTPVEIQIRTFEMHEVAEYGIAAHWAYKQGQTDKVEKDELASQLEWFNQIEDLQSDSTSATDFMESVKEDIFKDKVYVFTPKGDVHELPAGSVPLDFAYAIHSEVGNSTIGAKVNGKIVPLSHKLKNGDIVEVMTAKNSAGPSRDWVHLVASNKAKNKIRRYFKVKDREKNIEIGEHAIIEQLNDIGLSLNEALNKRTRQDLLSRFNFKSMEDLYAAVGFNELSAHAVAYRLKRLVRPSKDDVTPVSEVSDQVTETGGNPHLTRVEPMHIKHNNGVIVEGVDNLLFRLAKCCSPVPGDEIIGYITKGRGITVHRKDCPNVQLDETADQDRLLPVDWENEASQDNKHYEVGIEINAFDRHGIVNDVLEVMSPLTEHVTNLNATTNHKTNTVTVKLRFFVRDTAQLNRIAAKLKEIPDVDQVKRL
ncbi:MAG: bifunctional (p)ppGpp synthetase/guanosine-3',5'-bis(diphosphate) 3'-pyrophosphohydrolase [Aerococcus sp.]|nr:bifunctional (p)ppGpp synthetase/guanosine-3',5'-bis(diphosphate) 3'-pyrophosphohydrolase [Aerococcus sp.]